MNQNHASYILSYLIANQNTASLYYHTYRVSFKLFNLIYLGHIINMTPCNCNWYQKIYHLKNLICVQKVLKIFTCIQETYLAMTLPGKFYLSYHSHIFDSMYIVHMASYISNTMLSRLPGLKTLNFHCHAFPFIFKYSFTSERIDIYTLL